MHTSVQEIHVASDSSYFLRVDWEGRSLMSGFQLLLTDGQEAWRGEVSEEAVSAEAEELEMQRDQYVQDVQRALSQEDVQRDIQRAPGEGEGSASYSFMLDPHPPRKNQSVTLTYEKRQRDISFRLGRAVLEAVAEPTEAVRKLLVHSLQRGNDLRQKNQNLEEQNQQLTREQQRIRAEMKRYTGGKEELESELFSRFVLVLNEKKAKIRSLQDTITKLQDSRTSDGQKSSRSGTAGQDKAEDDYGGSTDEETACNLPPPESPPSSLDDSLRDITDVAPCRKRRLRHLGTLDVPLTRPDPETLQKRRSNPGSSKKPVSSADAAVEDLFEDF